MINSSLLSLQNEEQVDYVKSKYDNPYLRIGTVTNIIPAKDPINKNKLIDEYEVVTIEQNKNSGLTQTVYRNCIPAFSFGSANDFLFYRYKVEKKSSNLLKGIVSKEPLEGATVLLLCANGFIETPIILGALTHPKSPKQLDGHALHFQYNDVNVKIEDSGQLILSFNKSKTSLTFTKDGDVSLFLADGFELKALKKDGKIILTVPNDINTLSKNINIDVKEKTNIKSSKEFNLESAKSAIKLKQVKIEGSKLEIKMNDIKLSGSKVVVEGSNIELKGSIVDIKSNMVRLGTGASLPVPTSLTQVLVIGNLGVPATGIMTGPFSSKVLVSS